MNIAVFLSTVESLDLCYLHIISTHDRKVDIIPIPPSHFASKWYNFRSAFQIGRCKQNILIGFMLTTQACGRVQ